MRFVAWMVIVMMALCVCLAGVGCKSGGGGDGDGMALKDIKKDGPQPPPAEKRKNMNAAPTTGAKTP